MHDPDTALRSRQIHVTGRRTRLRPGAETRYDAVHASIPTAVFDALRSCGVVRWQIWRDGRTLFHLIETEGPYGAMVERVVAQGPIDSEWDATIGALLEQGEGSDVILPLLWTMTRTAQYAGAAGESLAAPA